MARYFYGCKDGRIVSILDVPFEEYGLRCGCTCVRCGEPLEACSIRPDNLREAHFKHRKSTREATDEPRFACSPDWANERACICSQRKSSKKSSVLPFLPLEPSPPTELPVSLKTWAGNPSSLLVGVRYPLRTSNQIRKIAKSMRRKFSPNTASTETISHKPLLLTCF